LEEENEVQQRRENDVAVGLEAKRQECVGIRDRKRINPANILQLDKKGDGSKN